MIYTPRPPRPPTPVTPTPRPQDPQRGVVDPAQPNPQPHLQDMMEVVGALTGKVEINPGVLLKERSTQQSRALTREFIKEQFEGLGLTAEDHKYSRSGTNVFATLPATNGSDEYIVVGAHYDSVHGGPGANDNATGVAMVLDAARHLSGMEDRTKSVIFVLFDEEEIGLRGSAAFAQSLRDQGLNVGSVHTVDQMGWDADGDRAVEIDGASPKILALYQNAAKEGALEIPIQPVTFGSTDHVPFQDLGFDAMAISEEYVGGDTTPHYHTPRDTYETVNWDYLTSSTKLLDRALEDLVELDPAAVKKTP
ncbi:MAG: M20/M25/M40 family metallo-hydrolase [Myxococcota bacterium]|nr:M20/M25/M40 family metallo-hydrolase [Myxococcota bacterium]